MVTADTEKEVWAEIKSNTFRHKLKSYFYLHEKLYLRVHKLTLPFSNMFKMRDLLPAISSAFSLAAISSDQWFIERTVTCSHNVLNELVRTLLSPFVFFWNFPLFTLTYFSLYSLYTNTPCFIILHFLVSSFPFSHLHLCIMLMPMSGHY